MTTTTDETTHAEHGRDVCKCGHDRMQHRHPDAVLVTRKGMQPATSGPVCRLCPTCTEFQRVKAWLDVVPTPAHTGREAPDFGGPIRRIGEAPQRLIESFRDRYVREYSEAIARGQCAPIPGKMGEWNVVHRAIRAALQDVKRGLLKGFIELTRENGVAMKEGAIDVEAFCSSLEEKFRDEGVEP